MVAPAVAFEETGLAKDMASAASGLEPAPAAAAADARRILAAADEILAQGESLLAALSDELYARPLAVAFNASIGGHYRHCLDHFVSWFGGRAGASVDYDHRARDPRVEQDAGFALGLTRQLRDALAAVRPAELSREASARCEVSYLAGDSPVTRSSLARELVYVIAHAIHHYALISVMARLLAVELPVRFGVAPSTVAHQQAGAA